MPKFINLKIGGALVKAETVARRVKGISCRKTYEATDLETLHHSNPWVLHVKNYQRAHGCSYREAMVNSRATYKR